MCRRHVLKVDQFFCRQHQQDKPQVRVLQAARNVTETTLSDSPAFLGRRLRERYAGEAVFRAQDCFNAGCGNIMGNIGMLSCEGRHPSASLFRGL